MDRFTAFLLPHCETTTNSFQKNLFMKIKKLFQPTSAPDGAVRTAGCGPNMNGGFASLSSINKLKSGRRTACLPLSSAWPVDELKRHVSMFLYVWEQLQVRAREREHTGIRGRTHVFRSPLRCNQAFVRPEQIIIRPAVCNRHSRGGEASA